MPRLQGYNVLYKLIRFIKKKLRERERREREIGYDEVRLGEREREIGYNEVGLGGPSQANAGFLLLFPKPVQVFVRLDRPYMNKLIETMGKLDLPIGLLGP